MNIQGILLAAIFLLPSLTMAQSSAPPDMSKANPPPRSFVVIDKNKDEKNEFYSKFLKKDFSNQ
jgi:hypothetical protein